MSITVELSFGERFINWFPGNTKLYVRGERGADAVKTSALYNDLAGQLNTWIADKYRRADRNDFTVAQAYADGEVHGRGDLAEVLAERDRHRETLRRIHGWLRLCVTSGHTSGMDSALRSLEATEPWLFRGSA